MPVYSGTGDLNLSLCTYMHKYVLLFIFASCTKVCLCKILSLASLLFVDLSKPNITFPHFQLCGLLAGQACTTANLNNDNFIVLGVCNFGLANACNLPLSQVKLTMILMNNVHQMSTIYLQCRQICIVGFCR